MLATTDLNYELPADRVATYPATPRESARLLVVSRSDSSVRIDAIVADLPRFLRPKDCLVLNTTRVIAARIAGYRADTGGRVGGLYLRSATEVEWSRSHGTGAWIVLLHGKTLRSGVRVCLFANTPGGQTPFQLSLIRRHEDETGGWIAAILDAQGKAVARDDLSILEEVGLTPLPPYIMKARRNAAVAQPIAPAGLLAPEFNTQHRDAASLGVPPAASAASEQLDCTREAGGHCPESTAAATAAVSTTTLSTCNAGLAGMATAAPFIAPAPVAEPDEASDRERYQTVYASQPGSVAAPTAGLHLTPPLLATLASQGVQRSDVVLHVGTGTFKPIETPFVEQHPMHSEWCSMSHQARDTIFACRAAGGRVICVGTTAARTVESFAGYTFPPPPQGAEMQTRLLITPGHEFMWMDGLLTNFHLPRSTLLALVGSLLPGGIPQLKEIYAHAIEHKYRFFSYGDAMLILP